MACFQDHLEMKKYTQFPKVNLIYPSVSTTSWHLPQSLLKT